MSSILYFYSRRKIFSNVNTLPVAHIVLVYKKLGLYYYLYLIYCLYSNMLILIHKYSLLPSDALHPVLNPLFCYFLPFLRNHHHQIDRSSSTNSRHLRVTQLAANHLHVAFAGSAAQDLAVLRLLH